MNTADLLAVLPPMAPLAGALAMNRALVTLIPAGSAVGLFPVITPAAPNLNATTGAANAPGSISDLPHAVSSSPIPSPDPDAGPRTAEGMLGTAADAFPRSAETPVLTMGLVAVGLAMLLVTTRLSVRRRTAKRDRRG